MVEITKIFILFWQACNPQIVAHKRTNGCSVAIFNAPATYVVLSQAIFVLHPIGRENQTVTKIQVDFMVLYILLKSNFSFYKCKRIYC